MEGKLYRSWRNMNIFLYLLYFRHFKGFSFTLTSEWLLGKDGATFDTSVTPSLVSKLPPNKKSTILWGEKKNATEAQIKYSLAEWNGLVTLTSEWLLGKDDATLTLGLPPPWCQNYHQTKNKYFMGKKKECNRSPTLSNLQLNEIG